MIERLTSALEYACYAVIFGGILLAWVATPAGMH